MRGIPGSPSKTTADDLADRSGGDARLAHNTLEIAVMIVEGRDKEKVGIEDVDEALQRRIVRYDKKGDQHYDVISAFIKSVRGSDPDGGRLLAHTMIEAGEDPKFIARRLVVLASEDIGLAHHGALGIAVDAARALEGSASPRRRMPSPMPPSTWPSRPQVGLDGHGDRVGQRGGGRDAGRHVPTHLRSAATAGSEAMGHGVGYHYPHDDSLGVVPQQYLPDEATGGILFGPGRWRGSRPRRTSRPHRQDPQEEPLAPHTRGSGRCPFRGLTAPPAGTPTLGTGMWGSGGASLSDHVHPTEVVRCRVCRNDRRRCLSRRKGEAGSGAHHTGDDDRPGRRLPQASWALPAGHPASRGGDRDRGRDRRVRERRTRRRGTRLG